MTSKPKQPSDYIQDALWYIGVYRISRDKDYLNSSFKSLDLAEKINPNFSIIYYVRSRLYLLINDWKKSIESVTKGIELETDSKVLSNSYFLRGCSYLMIEEFQRSIDDIRMSISKKSDFQEAFTYLDYVTKISNGEIEFNVIDAFIDLRTTLDKFDF